jgi:hypothetical protein
MVTIAYRRAGSSLGIAVALLAGAAIGCNHSSEAPTLSKQSDTEEAAELPPVPADGPKLGALADVSPVLERPTANAKQIGYLHAGAKVARAEQPFSTNGCEGGWYPIWPRGVMCAGKVATTDLSHPTLLAMALAPKLDESLPYTYARTRQSTPLFKRDAQRDNAVQLAGKVAARAGMAIVGSWSALDPEGQMQRLGMLTNGLFVKATDLQAAEPSDFSGIEFDDKHSLPVAFVVKRGVHAWQVEGTETDKLGELGYHDKLQLTGRFRTLGGQQYWAVDDGRYVRHRDVTVVRRRHIFPDFSTKDQKWIDISIITGTAVAYEGHRPVLATLVSVGRDRLGDPKSSASTAQGTFHIVGKHITAAKLDPKGLAENHEVFDLPWVMELSSGQLMHAAYWHSRFGIEHGPGNVQFAPADAKRLWLWTTPTVPAGWHGVNQPDPERTIVHMRK